MLKFRYVDFKIYNDVFLYAFFFIPLQKMVFYLEYSFVDNLIIKIILKN